MQPQPLTAGASLPAAPTFYLTRRQPLGPGAILLGAAIAVFALSSVVYALGHAKQAHRASPGDSVARTGPGAASTGKDEDDDPNAFDTIVLGDPGDAPAPALPGDHVSAVHAFRIVHLPRFGDETGLIPDTPAGRQLYAWLAAFNQRSYPALANVLPTADLAETAAAQIELRETTGGFALLSAKEIQPGLLVFRLRDQTTQTEALGTLQLRANSRPAAIASFSLRAIPVVAKPVATPAATPTARS